MTEQSELVQQVMFEMHALLAAHTRYPGLQAHVPPGPEHDSPPTGQLALVQQLLLAMQALLTLHAV
jgi:hypothetical protein